MAKRSTSGKRNRLEQDVQELRRSVDDFRTLLQQNVEVSKTALEGTDRAIFRMTWIAGIAMFLISILSAGGLMFGLWSKLRLPDEARNQVGTQVPPVVASSVGQSVPQAVRDELGAQIPAALEQIRSTVVSQVVPTALAGVQAEAAIAAATAVQEKVGNYTIVISSDLDLDEAKSKTSEARGQGYDPVIYKIGDYYATTIGRYSTEEQLRTDLEKVRVELQPRAYFLNLDVSCPYPRFFNAGFYGCFLEPLD